MTSPIPCEIHYVGIYAARNTSPEVMATAYDFLNTQPIYYALFWNNVYGDWKVGTKGWIQEKQIPSDEELIEIIKGNKIYEFTANKYEFQVKEEVDN